MIFLKKRETLIENITMMAIASAINAALALLSTFIPFSSFFVILVLPVISALTAYYCKDKYLLLYVISSSAVSILSTCYDLSITIFDVIPALIVGTLFGFLLKKNAPSEYSILIVSLIKLGLNYLMCLLLKLIYGVDIIDSFIKLLNLSEKENISQIVPLFIFAYSLIQESISFLIIYFSTANFDHKEQSFLDICIILNSIGAIILAVTAFLIAYLSYLWGYLLGGIAIYLSIASTKTLFRKNPWWIYLLLCALCVSSFYLTMFMYDKLDKNISPLLFLSIFSSLSLSNLVSSLKFKTSKGEKE